MTPEQVAKSGSEHAEQSALFCWSHLQETKEHYPELDTELLFAIPNGGARGDSAKSRAIRGGQLKAEGVKDGVPDMFLSVARGGYFGMYIEMKVKNNKPSRAQLKFKDSATSRNYLWVCCYSWQEARDNLIKYSRLPYTQVMR